MPANEHDHQRDHSAHMPPSPPPWACFHALVVGEFCMNQPVTSFAVIVTSYNYRDFVVEAVQSALTQSRKPAQVIVVDDGSTDGSDALLREHFGADERVLLVCGSNGGQLAAFQCGVAQASADVVCFLDSDDRWAPDYLARIGELYDSRRDVDFVFTDMQHFGEENKVVGFHRSAVDLGYTAVITYALTRWYGAPTSALSMRVSWARKVVDVPDSFRETWRLSADNCLVFGASVLGAKKYYLPTGSVDYRIHGKNGWWSNRSASLAYTNRLRSRGLIGYYARVAGLDESCIELSKFEYKTKPDPLWAETKRYAALAMRGSAPWWKRVEHMFAILLGSRATRQSRTD
jgi:glycosyltransferase involved in cell wall biosynthesis